LNIFLIKDQVIIIIPCNQPFWLKKAHLLQNSSFPDKYLKKLYRKSG